MRRVFLALLFLALPCGAVAHDRVVIPAAQWQIVSGFRPIAAESRMLAIADGVASWQSEQPLSGRYQLWVSVYAESTDAKLAVSVNQDSYHAGLFDMRPSRVAAFYDQHDRRIRNPKTTAIKPYFLRRYCGSYDLAGETELRLELRGPGVKAIGQVEWVREQTGRDLEPLLRSAIAFFREMHRPGALVADAYNVGGKTPGNIASTASAGMALVAHSISHELGGYPDAAERVIELLQLYNGRDPKLQPARHRSGHFMHFTNIHSGEGRSEYSTIDTAILVAGALVARNTFADQRVRDEADKLWQSIDWSAAVIKADPALPTFYLTGAQMDGNAKGSITMFNEYLLLAWLCQQSETQLRGPQARSHILPEMTQMPLAVYRNRLMLASKHGGRQPSFLVQFPFYLSNLCTDDLYFSWMAAQALADRDTCVQRFQSPSVWGCGPGATPSRGYAVFGYHDNHESVVAPRIVSGFIPTYPLAANDLRALWQTPRHRMALPFGEILPRFVPGNQDWQPPRIAGVDFACMLFGMGAYHPKIGMEFYRKKTRFTFAAP